jgi:hypothetical protein
MHSKSNVLLVSAPMLAIATILMLNTISSYLNMGNANARDERSLNASEMEKVGEGEVSIARRGDNLQEPFAYTVPKEIEGGEGYVNNILPYIIGVASASVTFIVLNRLKISRR